MAIGVERWEPTWGTRIKDKEMFFGDASEFKMIIPDTEHDDLDCLEDLETYDVVVNVGTNLNPSCILTKKGFEVINELLQWKQNGGNYASFCAKPEWNTTATPEQINNAVIVNHNLATIGLL